MEPLREALEIVEEAAGVICSDDMFDKEGVEQSTGSQCCCCLDGERK
jgi:hypothetical protein